MHGFNLYCSFLQSADRRRPTADNRSGKRLVVGRRFGCGLDLRTHLLDKRGQRLYRIGQLRGQHAEDAFQIGTEGTQVDSRGPTQRVIYCINYAPLTLSKK